jgi:hypothetical protein
MRLLRPRSLITLLAAFGCGDVVPAKTDKPLSPPDATQETSTFASITVTSVKRSNGAVDSTAIRNDTVVLTAHADANSAQTSWQIPGGTIQVADVPAGLPLSLRNEVVRQIWEHAFPAQSGSIPYDSCDATGGSTASCAIFVVCCFAGSRLSCTTDCYGNCIYNGC